MNATDNILDFAIKEQKTFSIFFDDNILAAPPIEDVIETFEGYISMIDNENVCVKMYSSISRETIYASIARNDFEDRITQGTYGINTQFSWIFYHERDEIKLIQPIQSNILGDYSDYINRRLEEVLRQNEQGNENR